MASADEVRKALDLFDPFGKGFLTLAEMDLILRRGQEHALTEAEVKQFMEKHDTNRDGKLDLDELSKAIGTDQEFRNAAKETRVQGVVDELITALEENPEWVRIARGVDEILGGDVDALKGSMLETEFKRILHREFSK